MMKSAQRPQFPSDSSNWVEGAGPQSFEKGDAWQTSHFLTDC
jgi:hypothetical protein